MRIEYGRQETEAEVRTRYLKEMMRVRNVTMKQLSMMTRINIRTLERYTSGRTDTADAAGVVRRAYKLRPFHECLCPWRR